MKQTFSYSVSMRPTQQSPIHGQAIRSPDREASQVGGQRLGTPIDSLSNPVHKPQIPRGNGFLSMKNAAKEDYFTIRADAIQDSVLSQVDSLAEYLVWDGMDRRLRAIASATNTIAPEATVSIQQIANDIKVRVGHNFCERTIERAIKKLADCGIILSKQQFSSGRRQASSYQLCFTADMQSRLRSSRRNKKGKTMDEDIHADSKRYEHTSPVVQRSENLTKIGQLASRFGLAGLTESTPVQSNFQEGQKVCNFAHSGNLHAAPDSSQSSTAMSSDAAQQLGNFDDCQKVCKIAHSGNLDDVPESERGKTASNRNKPENPRTFRKTGKVCKIAHPANSYRQDRGDQNVAVAQQAVNQPTPVSPLFKEERKINKNIFSYSDFLLKKHAAQNETETTTAGNHGYFLDPVHQKGWICSEKSALKPYLGDLSRHAFFAGKRNIEDLSAWFQDMEQKISEGSLALLELLRNAGIEVMKTQQSPVSYGVLFNA
ncbi:hypothetical protein [Acidithiobacillus thiooxidans]|uniref:hypothetical protein n=1 Tax=Acidithiobacillus thiooxidans TaxID=930 RepID=UPI00112254B5|nr:hypothetical protein [Acidithiobacillus thiooxidans]